MKKGDTNFQNRQFLTTNHLLYVAVALASVVLGAMLFLPAPLNLAPFGIVAGGLFVFACFRRPFVGLFVYSFVFFFRPYELFPTPIPYERLIALLILAILAVYISAKWIPVRFSQLDLAVTSFFVAAAISVPSFTDMGDTSKAFEAFFEFFKVYLVYFFTLQLVNSRTHVQAIIWLFILSNFFMATSTSINYHMGNFRVSMGIQRARGIAETGLFSHPNSIASSVVIGLPFLYYLYQHYKRPLARLFFAGSAAIGIWTVVITGSRGGMLGLFAFMMIIAWRSKHRWVAVAAAMIMVLLVFAIMPDQYQERLLSLGDIFSDKKTGANDSALGRLDGFLTGLQFFLQRPLTGVGIGCFARAHYYAGGAESDAHNLPGQLLGELGGVGLVTFIWFAMTFIRSMKDFLNYYQVHGVERDFFYYTTKAIQVSVMILFVQGISGHNLFRYNWYIFACFMSIMMALTPGYLKSLVKPDEEEPLPVPATESGGDRDG